MQRRQSTRRRWATAARWPVGIVLTGWRYTWRTTAVHRWELTGSLARDAAPPLPEGIEERSVQSIQDGEGPAFHRVYRVRIVGSLLSAEDLMRGVVEDLDRVAPSEFASFEKVDGDGPLSVGDEYLVRMPGPWDGPVEVVDAGPTHFRLATLPGHLEAGQIEFRSFAGHRWLGFEIESWARSGDRLADVMYSRLRLAKEIQVHMWISVLEKVARLAGGRIEGGISLTTCRIDREALAGTGRTTGRVDALDSLALLRSNFDARALDGGDAGAGWHRDELIEALPHEPSGPPREGGSWQVARRLMDEYQLADPTVVRATYDSDRRMSGRDMLLRIRFGLLHFNVGVRIGEVYDEERELDGRPARVFGWYYRTLEGHFEEGQMNYELWKWLDTGEVEFRLHAVSRAARSGPLLQRLGFRMFGRSQQLSFYRQICRRARRLTEAQLELEAAARRRHACSQEAAVAAGSSS